MRTTVLAFAVLMLAACDREPTIERADVERVITTLAADTMLGRAAFTPAADRAARVVREEFRDIGLETLEGLDDYLQGFSVYSRSLDSARVVLNGRVVPPEQTAVSLGTAALRWRPSDDVRVSVIGPSENPMQAVSAAFSGGVNALVVMHTAHRGTFERLKRFLSGGSRSLDLEGGRSRVVVLASDARVRAFEVDASASVETVPAANVVGRIPGRRTNELVLFSAHYDHVGVGAPVNGDSIFNGANDDASGTTAVIALARYFKAKGRPERTLVFAAFTAEESGGFGSRAFSQRLNPDQIVAMFNIEMIGKPSAQGPNHAWITGFERSSFGEILQGAVTGTEYRFDPDPYPQENLFYRSDNATLARLGVPAHSISTTPMDVDQDYHQVSDEVGTLDLDHLTNTIRAIARGAAPIIAGTATPTRVDTTQVRR